MKISKIEIYNYKSIGLKCTLELDSSSTVLVGKSNVGKSNILRAIQFAFTEKRLDKKSKCSWNENEEKSVRIFFSIEDKDIKQLIEISSILKDKQKIILTKNVNGSRSLDFFPPVEESTIEVPASRVKDILTNVRSRVRKYIRSWESIMYDYDVESEDEVNVLISSLKEWAISEKSLFPAKTYKAQLEILKRLENDLVRIRIKLDDRKYADINTRSIKTGLSYMLSEFNSNVIPAIVYRKKTVKGYEIENVLAILPSIKFVDSDEDFSISDKIYFSEVGENRNHFMNLLIQLSGCSINKLIHEDGRIREKEFKICNSSLAEIFSEYWNQEDLVVALRKDSELVKEETNDSSNDLNEREVLKHFYELDIIDSGGHWGSISEQGPGFQWFFWFVVRHLIEVKGERDIFLILDEPALHLHASAQNDLLERFDKSLNARIQFLYTTHSPFLINKNYPYRIRSVQKGSDKERVRGTYLVSKPYHSSSGNPWEPIRSAIGLSAGASLYVGGNNLIVEGITDQILLSALAQSVNRVEKRSVFNMNKVSICFGGDETNSISLALFCQQEEISVKVLFDSDTIARKKAKLIKGNFPEESIFDINGLAKSSIDIEDLFDTSFYHKCFIRAYEEIGFNKEIFPKNFREIKSSLERPKLAKWGRSKFYEEWFKKEEGLGDFGKIIVAKKLAEELSSLTRKELNNCCIDAINVLKSVWIAVDNWND